MNPNSIVDQEFDSLRLLLLLRRRSKSIRLKQPKRIKTKRPSA